MVHQERKNGAKYTSTIHRKCGQHVEENQPDVDCQERADECRGRCLKKCIHTADESEQWQHQDAETERNDDINRGSGNCDEKYLPWFLTHAFQARHTADKRDGDRKSKRLNSSNIPLC